jgi:hypothetical protein
MNVADKLLPYQIAPFEQLRDGFKRGLQAQVDFSDTGTGKTYVAAAIAADLRLPVLVVCPYSVKSSWNAAAAHFEDEISVINYESLVTGRSGFGCWENQAVVDRPRPHFLRCSVCQRRFNSDADLEASPCQYHPAGIHCIERKTLPIDYGKFIWKSAVETIYFDEVHRCSGIDSLNAESLVGAKRDGRRILGISATAAWSPLKMRALGYALDLHGDKTALVEKCGVFTYERAPDYYRWSRRFGCRRHPAFRGWHWFASESEQGRIMGTIGDQILPAKGIRVAIKDVPGFPKVSVSPQLFELPESPDRATAESLAALDERCGDPLLWSEVTRRLRDRQRTELLEVSTIVEHAQDRLDTGCSVAIFVNFSQTLDELGKRFGIEAFVDGRTVGLERDNLLGKFRAGKDRLILLNAAAGGVGISLDSDPGAFSIGYGIVVPGEDAVVFSQTLGRLPRQGGQEFSIYKIFLAAGVQEKVYRNLKRKCTNIESLRATVTDADLTSDRKTC